MNQENGAGLNALISDMNKYKKDLMNQANALTGRFGEIVQKLDVVREKKTKMNKMPATMMQNKDKTIMIVFDNPEDSDKFFGK